MTKMIFLILGTTLSFGLLSNGYANSQSRVTIVIPGVIPVDSQRHTTVATQYRYPPHAPVHSYRQHYNDHDLQFDSNFAAYRVIGNPGIYFYDDHYLRFYGGIWQMSNRIGGAWHPTQYRHVPQQLRGRFREQHGNKYLAHDAQRDAPRHGYRRHYQGYDMTFNTNIDAYHIAKQPNVYFYKNRYIRRHGAVWQSANKLAGQWASAKGRQVPVKLRKKKYRKEKQKSHENRNKNREH